MVVALLLFCGIASGQVSEKGQSKKEVKEKSSKPASPRQQVIAEGAGGTSDEVLKDAFRSAVRQVVGAVVDAETLIKDDEVITDKVLTYSDGMIKTYEVVSKKVRQGHLSGPHQGASGTPQGRLARPRWTQQCGGHVSREVVGTPDRLVGEPGQLRHGSLLPDNVVERVRRVCRIDNPEFHLVGQ